VKSVEKLIRMRRIASLRLADVARLTRSLKNVRPFITALDWTPGASIDAVALAAQLTPVIKPQQLSLFG
jgi:predicted DNA-binding helix-hairpin-helix protein